MRAVNLLPKDTGRTRRSLPSPWILVAALAPVVAIGLVYLGYSIEHSSLVNKRSELSAVDDRLAALTAHNANNQAESTLFGLQVSRQQALQDALTKQTSWDVTLNDLERVLPNGIWLTLLNAQSPTPADVAPALAPTTTTSTTTTTTTTTTTATTPTPAAPPPNPTAFTITGYAHSQESVAQLLARLRLLPMLGNVTLASTAQATMANGTPVVQFSVSASIQAIPKGAGL